MKRFRLTAVFGDSTILFVGVAAVFALLLEPLDAAPLTGLGSYEREAVERVLSRRMLRIDENPKGKPIGEISIVNLEVFGPDTAWLQGLNAIHHTTLESTIRNELLAKPGDIWNDALIQETERIARNPKLSSFLVAIPIRSDNAGHVDLLIVTRDIWSLRTNSEVINQDGRLTFLEVAAAENNIFGRRKHASFIFGMDQGEYAFSGRWRDLNVMGKRWQLTLRPRIIVGRASGNYEGTQSYTRLAYPLWSLGSRWGFEFLSTHKTSIARNFEGGSLATYDDPSTEDMEEIPQEYRLRDFALRSDLRYSLGHQYKHTFSAGYEFLSLRPGIIEVPGVPMEVASHFGAELLPREEVSSAFTLGFEFFEARYHTYRNLNGYDLPEVKQVGASLTANIALALREIGSDRGFFRSSLQVGYLLKLPAEALLSFTIGFDSRLEHLHHKLEAIDISHRVSWFAASPALKHLRLVIFGETSLRKNVKDNVLVHLGGQADLRGYQVGTFTGTSYYRSSVEIRSLPSRVGSLRVGYLAFWDVGDAADSAGALRTHHSLGFGVKALIPQTGESLMFLHWSLPVDRDADHFPGQIAVGFGQEL